MNMPDSLLGNENLALGSDPALAALFGMLDGPGGTDPLALLRAQLETQAQSDPRTAMILRFLEQRRQQQLERGASEEAEQSSPGETQEHPADHAGNPSELQDLMDQAYSELEALRTRNDTLAAALGACYLCFGQDSLCEKCGGRGVPGSRPPEPAAFRKYVLPAVRRAQAIEAKRGGRAPPRERSSGQQPGNPHPVPG